MKKCYYCGRSDGRHDGACTPVAIEAQVVTGVDLGSQPGYSVAWVAMNRSVSIPAEQLKDKKSELVGSYAEKYLQRCQQTTSTAWTKLLLSSYYLTEEETTFNRIYEGEWND